MGCHTQFRGLRPNRPFGSSVAAALSIEYVISAHGELHDGHTAHHPVHYTHELGGPAAALSLKSAGLFRPAVEPSMPFDFQQLGNFRLF